jgi:hypothetical protein
MTTAAGPSDRFDRAELFDEAESVIRCLLGELGYGQSRLPDATRVQLLELFDPNALARLHTFLSYELFSFFKFFDSDLPDDHETNYYMEREWRVIGRVAFDINDIERVYIPRIYATRFRADVPEYTGQITFSL